MSEILIRLIIQQDFEDSILKVCDLLIKYDKLNFSEIVFQSKLSSNEVRQALVILLKHNIISFFKKTNISNIEQKPIAEQIESSLYTLSPQEVLHRLRFPKFLSHISRNLGSLPQFIIQEYFENGHLSVSECLAKIQEQVKSKTIETYSENEILEAIGSLIKGQYLVQVDTSIYSHEFHNYSLNFSKSKAGKRKAQDNLKEEFIEERKIKKIKLLPIDEINLFNRNGLTQNLRIQLGLSGQIFDKNKVFHGDHNETELDNVKNGHKNDEYGKTGSLFYDTINHEEKIFNVNYRKLIHDFRTKVIIKNSICQHTKSLIDALTEKIDYQCSCILQVILQSSQLYSKASTFKLTGILIIISMFNYYYFLLESFTIKDIIKNLVQYPGLNEESVAKCIQMLQKEKLISFKLSSKRYSLIQFIQTSVSNEAFRVDLEYLVNKLHNKQFEKIVEEKYGNNCSRIFRVLNNLGYLAEKQISDICLISIQETRACLKDLISIKAVEIKDQQIQEGTKIQVYGVKASQALASFIEETYNTLANLKKREEVEINKLKTLVEMNLSEEEAEKTNILTNKLQSSILELDDFIMSFCEF